jgi:predicted dehydrogenase
VKKPVSLEAGFFALPGEKLGMASAAPIRWGILSTANIAIKRFIPGVRASGNGVVAAIAARDQARADTVAEQLGIARAYGSYEALLADPEIDAVYIALPNALHAPWAIAAAEHGKPVLCEKPLARDAAEARHVVDVFAQRGVPLMEAFMYRFHPQHARVRELIDADAIGEVRAVRASFAFLLEPLSGRNVRLSGELAGGALMDVGCYAVNAARMLFAHEPLWASAQWDFRDDLGVEVALAGVLGFSDGRMATIDCGFRAAGKSSYQVAGTAGRIDLLDAFTPDPGRDVTIVITDVKGEQRFETLPGVDQYRLEAEEFSAALRGHRAPQIAATDAVANLRAMDALRASAHACGLRVTI